MHLLLASGDFTMLEGLVPPWKPVIEGPSLPSIVLEAFQEIFVQQSFASVCL